MKDTDFEMNKNLMMIILILSEKQCHLLITLKDIFLIFQTMECECADFVEEQGNPICM
jgi:hypothetical protein